MDAARAKQPINYDRSEKFGGAMYWCVAGGIAAIGLVAVNVLIDAVMIGIVQMISGVNACFDRFSDSLLGVVLAGSIITSILFGVLLWSMRSQMAGDAKLHDPQWAKHVRRWFTFSAFGVYLLAAPTKCMFILGMAYC